MMKKLAQIVCFLVIFGASAVAVHAQDADALIRIDDPLCTAGPGCVVLDYTGTTTTFTTSSPFDLSVADPPSFYNDPAPPANYNCASNFFTSSVPITASPFPPAVQFLGCAFAGGTLTNGDPYSLTISGADIPLDFSLGGVFQCDSSDLSACPAGTGTFVVDPTPEPSTAVLYSSGLLLIFLVGLVRKRRLVASFRT